MKQYTEGTKKFSRMLSIFEGRHRSVPEAVSRTVERIISRVRDEGDSALFDLTLKFDGFNPGAEGLVVTKREMEKAFGRLAKGVQKSLSLMAERIRLFHERQKEDGYSMHNDAGLQIAGFITRFNDLVFYKAGSLVSTLLHRHFCDIYPLNPSSKLRQYRY